MSTVKRVIHTDTYSAKSKFILDSLRTYMLDRWGSSQMERNAALAAVEIEPNGEIVWKIFESTSLKKGNWTTHSYYYYRSTYATRSDDQKVRDWIACSMKHIIYSEFRRHSLDANKSWKRSNKMKLDCFSDNTTAVTVAEAYCLFDKLLNRKTFSKRWKKPMLKEIIGEERDPVATELEIARREEDKKLDDKFNADTQALTSKKYEEMDIARTEIEKKYVKLQEDLKAAYLQAKKELADQLNFTTELPDFLA